MTNRRIPALALSFFCRNYSEPLYLGEEDDIWIAGKGGSTGIEYRDMMLQTSAKKRHDVQIVLSTLLGAKTAKNLNFGLDIADIPFSLVIVERNCKIAHKRPIDAFNCINLSIKERSELFSFGHVSYEGDFQRTGTGYLPVP